MRLTRRCSPWALGKALGGQSICHVGIEEVRPEVRLKAEQCLRQGSMSVQSAVAAANMVLASVCNDRNHGKLHVVAHSCQLGRPQAFNLDHTMLMLFA